MMALPPDCDHRILPLLHERGMIGPLDTLTLRALANGDGKVLHIVEGTRPPLFVKSSFPHWWRVEADIQQMVATMEPAYAQPILVELPEINGFAMRFFRPDEAMTWKSAADRTNSEPALAGHVGDHLGHFHQGTVGNPAVERAAEANRARMAEIRRSFLWHCVIQDPPSAAIVRHTVDDSLARRTALAHGDLGMRNVMTGPGGLFLIDFEKAWFGDPAFDCGWMLAALIRRAVYTKRTAIRHALPDCLRQAGQGWRRHVTWEAPAEAEARAIRIALIRCIASYQDRLDRRTSEPPQMVVDGIQVLKRLLHSGVDRFDDLAGMLASAGFSAETVA